MYLLCIQHPRIYLYSPPKTFFTHNLYISSTTYYNIQLILTLLNSQLTQDLFQQRQTNYKLRQSHYIKIQVQEYIKQVSNCENIISQKV